MKRFLYFFIFVFLSVALFSDVYINNGNIYFEYLKNSSDGDMYLCIYGRESILMKNDGKKYYYYEKYKNNSVYNYYYLLDNNKYYDYTYNIYQGYNHFMIMNDNIIKSKLKSFVPYESTFSLKSTGYYLSDKNNYDISLTMLYKLQSVYGEIRLLEDIGINNFSAEYNPYFFTNIGIIAGVPVFSLGYKNTFSYNGNYGYYKKYYNEGNYNFEKYFFSVKDFFYNDIIYADRNNSNKYIQAVALNSYSEIHDAGIRIYDLNENKPGSVFFTVLGNKQIKGGFSYNSENLLKKYYFFDGLPLKINDGSLEILYMDYMNNKINVGIYDFSKFFYFAYNGNYNIFGKNLSATLNIDFLRNSTTFNMTYNWNFETYINMRYSETNIVTMGALTNRFNFMGFYIKPLVSFGVTDIPMNDDLYYYNVAAGYEKWNDFKSEIQFGNTKYDSVWDIWNYVGYNMTDLYFNLFFYKYF